MMHILSSVRGKSFVGHYDQYMMTVPGTRHSGEMYFGRLGVGPVHVGTTNWA